MITLLLYLCIKLRRNLVLYCKNNLINGNLFQQKKMMTMHLFLKC